ncbi:MAG: putative metallopeptidase [Candidatus Micrarchaeota archaeon]|nr:putative metallopeptidase [Candidatus Micrarchaeota archaeon]
MEVEKALDVQKKLEYIVEILNSSEDYRYLNQFRIICMRSFKSKARAYARIWAFPKIWQKALDVGTFYVIEVLAENFDKLSEEKKEQVLIHELLHIPKTFSGALIEHKNHYRPINQNTVLKVWKKYKELELKTNKI